MKLAGDEGVEELHDEVLELESGTWNEGTELAWRMQFESVGRDIVWFAFRTLHGDPPEIKRFNELIFCW